MALFGKVSFATNCEIYSPGGGGTCDCKTTGGTLLSDVLYANNNAAVANTNVKICSSASDTTCSVSLTAPVTAGVMYLKNISSGATDYYKCTWLGGGIFSAGSAHIPSPPTAPTGLTATAASATQINLSWTDNSSDETGFKIESPAGTALTTTAANATSYNATGLTCNTSYTFVVKATNANGDSSSITANATTSACSTAVSAPIFNFNKPAEIFASEAEK